MSVRMRAWDKGQDAESSEQKQTLIPTISYYLLFLPLLGLSRNSPGTWQASRPAEWPPWKAWAAGPRTKPDITASWAQKSIDMLSWKTLHSFVLKEWSPDCLLQLPKVLFVVLRLISPRNFWYGLLGECSNQERGYGAREWWPKKKHFEGLCSHWTRQRVQYDSQSKIEGTSEGERGKWEQQRRGSQNNAAHCASTDCSVCWMCTAR